MGPTACPDKDATVRLRFAAHADLSGCRIVLPKKTVAPVRRVAQKIPGRDGQNSSEARRSPLQG